MLCRACQEHQDRGGQVGLQAGFRGDAQTFQNHLIKEYTLNRIRDPIII